MRKISLKFPLAFLVNQLQWSWIFHK